jgi:hypothetical protein
VWKGSEELRLHPGWADPTSEGNWSYVFLWYIDGKVTLDEISLKISLERYYEGLCRMLLTQKHISETKFIPVVAAVKKMISPANSGAAYTASIRILDFNSQQPIVLNAAIQVLTTVDKDKTAVRFDVSSRPFSHRVWTALEHIKVVLTP